MFYNDNFIISLLWILEYCSCLDTFSFYYFTKWRSNQFDRLIDKKIDIGKTIQLTIIYTFRTLQTIENVLCMVTQIIKPDGINKRSTDKLGKVWHLCVHLQRSYILHCVFTCRLLPFLLYSSPQKENAITTTSIRSVQKVEHLEETYALGRMKKDIEQEIEWEYVRVC